MASDLSPASFAVSPVWTWADDEESIEPVPYHGWIDLDELGGLFISADFEAPTGRRFTGYVVADFGFVFVVGLFAGDESVVFNRNLPEFADNDIQELSRLLGHDPGQLFPLKYTANVVKTDGTTLSGVFDFTPSDLTELLRARYQA